MGNFAKSWLPSGFIIKGTDANMVYKLAVEKGFFFTYLTQIYFICFPTEIWTATSSRSSRRGLFQISFPCRNCE